MNEELYIKHNLNFYRVRFFLNKNLVQPQKLSPRTPKSDSSSKATYMLCVQTLRTIGLNLGQHISKHINSKENNPRFKAIQIQNDKHTKHLLINLIGFSGQAFGPATLEPPPYFGGGLRPPQTHPSVRPVPSGSSVPVGEGGTQTPDPPRRVDKSDQNPSN